MKYLFNFFVKNAILTIGMVVMLLGIAISYIPNFQLDASSDSLVLEGDANLAYYKTIKEIYGSDDYLVISYQPKLDLLNVAQIEHLRSLRDDITKIPHVKSVTTILDVPLFRSPPLTLSQLADTKISIEQGNADLKLALTEFTSSPLYSDNLVSKDGKTTALLVQLSENTEHFSSDSTVQDLRNTIDKYRDNAKLFLGGLPMITTDIISYINSDLIVFSLAVMGLMIIILAFLFKQIRWVLIPISISLSAALIMTGILSFLNWKVTVISSNFFSLLLVMTLSVTIHLIVRFRELSHTNPELSYQDLIITTLEQMLKPCLFTTITTLVAFASLLISGIKPVIDFGWMMSVGVTLALALSFIAFPAIMSALPKPRPSKLNTDLRLTSTLANFTQNHGGKLITVIILLVLFSAFGISKLSVENRFIDYFKESTEINQGLTLIDENLGGTVPLEIIFNDLAEDYWFDSDLRNEIHIIHKHLESLPDTGKVLSLDTLMQLLTEINDGQRLNGFFLNIIRSRIPDEAKAQVLDPYISPENNQLRMVIRVRETSPDLKRNELILDINNFLINDMGFSPDSFHITGMLVLYNNMLQSLFDSQIKTISAVFLMILFMFFIIFRSFHLSIIALIPNILPSMFILGIMGLSGIPLDLMTITISAIAIGIGVDNAIHYIHRFKIEFAKDNDYLSTMHRSHQTIGLAMFYTSITVTLGFFILVLSNFIPSIYFGLFTATAMLSAVLANLTLLPYLILKTKPKILPN